MFGKKDKDREKAAPAPASAPTQARASQPAPRQQPQPAPQPAAQQQPQRVFAPRDEPPAVLGVAAVTWLDVCLGRMPNAASVRKGIVDAGFRPEPEATAKAIGRSLALDNKMLSFPIRDLKHEAWRKEQHGVPAAILLTTAHSDLGDMVFCSALFGGATEADAVKMIQHLAKSPPTVGGLTHDPDGKVLRRVFWKLDGQAGMLAMAVSGPENPDARDHLRALVAFNRAA